nr:MAG TPA: hypothetical protein [Caudoviricetes sp.]
MLKIAIFSLFANLMVKLLIAVWQEHSWVNAALTLKKCKSLLQTMLIQMQLSNIKNLTSKNYLYILRDNELLQSVTQFRYQNVFIARNRTA